MWDMSYVNNMAANFMPLFPSVSPIYMNGSERNKDQPVANLAYYCGLQHLATNTFWSE